MLTLHNNKQHYLCCKTDTGLVIISYYNHHISKDMCQNNNKDTCHTYFRIYSIWGLCAHCHKFCTKGTHLYLHCFLEHQLMRFTMKNCKVQGTRYKEANMRSKLKFISCTSTTNRYSKSNYFQLPQAYSVKGSNLIIEFILITN